ncbi:hypothetical protein QJQ45_016668 [Haematococcus lacustris]|nr:hypothetical protein QJQ45_016668 [Haematococcus lacustris]
MPTASKGLHGLGAHQCRQVSSSFARADDEYEDSEDEAPKSAEDDVLVLTEKNFDATIKKHKFVLTLAPEYAKAAALLKSHDADVVLGKVDATVETSLGTQFDVKGYPTLKWFVDGEAVDYNGPREADGIVSWIKKKTGPATTVVDDAKTLTELEGSNPVIVLGYFKEAKGDEYEAFKTAGAKTEDVTFVETTSSEVAAAAGLSEPGLTVVKNFKGEARATADFSGKISDASALAAFIKSEKMPLTIEFSQETSDKIFNSGLKQQLILWATAAQLEPGNAVYDAYKAAAQEYKGQIVFVTINNEGSEHEPITNFFGLKDAVAPVVLGFHMERSKKYKMLEEMSPAAVKSFAAAVLDGTAHVELKSAPIPENNKDEHVTIVVGKSVDDIVFADDKDVLLEIYAPWCGHCKQLDPIYKKLAKRFSKVNSVVIAKMDGTENEHPELDAKGFPTIYFIPAGSKTPISYDSGDRTLKALTKFIKENAKIPYTLPKKGQDSDAKDEL